MGDVVLGELLRARGLMPAGAQKLDFWVAPVAPSERLGRFACDRAAWRRSVAEYPLRDQALAKQLKAAGKRRRGARRVRRARARRARGGRGEVARRRQSASAPFDELIAQVRDHSSGSSDRPW
jgi:hypothetical protein